jgi:hypothetical protein
MNDRRPLTENQQRKKARAIKALVALASLYTENSGLMQDSLTCRTLSAPP